MSSDRKNLFGCPTCGFRVTSGEESCPRCGTNFEKDTRFECPFCGEHVDPSSNSCPSCHISYGEFSSRAKEKDTDKSVDNLLSEIIAVESAHVKKERKQFGCPQCSWMVDRSEERCPKCGFIFSEEVGHQCPICASIVNAEALSCSECGAKFAEEEGVPSDEIPFGPGVAEEVTPDVEPLEEVVTEKEPQHVEPQEAERDPEREPETEEALEQPEILEQETLKADVEEVREETPKFVASVPALEPEPEPEPAVEPEPDIKPEPEPVREAPAAPKETKKPKQRRVRVRKVKTKA